MSERCCDTACPWCGTAQGYGGAPYRAKITALSHNWALTFCSARALARRHRRPNWIPSIGSAAIKAARIKSWGSTEGFNL